jgi:NAD(P)-dependent dehydrogenase (short-subunit alcohol dehydrogenase family)
MKTRTVSSAASVVLTGVGLLAVGGVAAAAASIYRKRRAQIRGQVVVITGGSRGLGLALAEEFGRLGARLVLAARDWEELDRAKELLATRCAIEADSILTVASDLRRPEKAEALIGRAMERFGRVDILVNNAGIITVGPVENQSGENFRDVMNVNLFSGVDCSLAVLPQMIRRREGTIVNIASIGGKVAIPHLLPYTASKFAQVGFSQGLHAEVSSRGIHVLTVCPGLMRTGSHLNAFFSGDSSREYRWFSLLASLPAVSVSARHAARRIVRAVLWKEAEIAISPQASLAARLAPLLAELTSMALSAANRVLPGPNNGEREMRRGYDTRERELQPARRLGISAAKRYNQINGNGNHHN